MNEKPIAPAEAPLANRTVQEVKTDESTTSAKAASSNQRVFKLPSLEQKQKKRRLK